VEHALICPQCNAPLSPPRFARQVTCPYCGTTVLLDEASVSAALFRQAYRAWNSPASYAFQTWLSLGDRHWAVEKLIAGGDIADVYTGRLARWPTELALIKVLRDPKDAALFDNEWDALGALQKSEARGAATFTRLLPQPILHGDVTAGAFAGRRASIFRWASGFYHTFEEVIRAYPQGIPPRAAVWVWRRILEALAFIHASGLAHAALLPAHLLVQENEHGVRLVGFGLAGKLSEALPSTEIPHGGEPYYPARQLAGLKRTPDLDLIMSARCIAALLGGDPESAGLPDAVPAPLADAVRRVARSRLGAGERDAWAIRQELGEIADRVFGPPQFNPILMPS